MVPNREGGCCGDRFDVEEVNGFSSRFFFFFIQVPIVCPEFVVYIEMKGGLWVFAVNVILW